MPDISAGGLSQSDVLGMIMSHAALSFVSPTPMTLAALMANFPASAGYANKYAVVSNLFNGTSMSATGGVQEVVRCRYDVTANAYRWVPQRTDYSITITSTGGTVNLVPLVTPPTIRLSGTLVSALSVVPDPANAWVGLRWRAIQNSVLGIFVTTITGLLGSNVTLLGNTTRDIDYTSAGYFST